MNRRNKTRKWIGIVIVVIVAIPVIIHAVLVWTTSSRLEKQIAAIREAGDPVCLADLAPGPIPAEEDAAVFLQHAKGDVEAIWKELSTVYDSPRYDSGQFNETELKSIEAAFEAYPSLLPLLREAADCPGYASQLDFTVGPEEFLDNAVLRSFENRDLIRALRVWTLLLLAQGEKHEALQTCLMMLHLTRHFEREPMIISYLMTMGCRGTTLNTVNHVLRSGPLPREDRRILDTELALSGDLETLNRALKEERTFGIDFVPTIPGRNVWQVAHIQWNRAESSYLELFGQHITSVERPYLDVMASLDAYEAKGEMRQIMAQLSVPALRVGRLAVERDRARTRCLRVFNALQDYVEENETAKPALTDLGLPAKVTTDPYTGKPLTMKKLPEGWLIYSVGKNLKDDSGSLEDEQDVGVGPLGPAEND